jgi:hypothetical protein
MHMIAAQMAEICHPLKLLQQAQALEHWADCRERAVARLELKISHLENQRRTDEATRLCSAAHYLRQAAVRDRLHAAALRRAAQR